METSATEPSVKTRMDLDSRSKSKMFEGFVAIEVSVTSSPTMKHESPGVDGVSSAMKASKSTAWEPRSMKCSSTASTLCSDATSEPGRMNAWYA